MDWLVHVLVPWIGCKLIQLRYIKLMNRDIALVMLGAVLPDIIAVGYLLQAMGVNYGGSLLPFHTLIGSVLVAAIISLLFSKKTRVFYLLAAGFVSHYALDSLLLHAGGGMVLLFPFNWTWGFQLGLVPSDSWVPTIVVLFIAISLFTVLRLKKALHRTAHKASR